MSKQHSPKRIAKINIEFEGDLFEFIVPIPEKKIPLSVEEYVNIVSQPDLYDLDRVLEEQRGMREQRRTREIEEKYRLKRASKMSAYRVVK